MSNGKTLIDGISYLASAYCEGEASGVEVLSPEDTGSIRLCLVNEDQKIFTDADVEAMETLGFTYTQFDEDEYADVKYSFFEFSAI